MENLTKEAIEKEAIRDGSPRAGGKAQNGRPKDAATLIVLKGEPGDFKFLMGRRSLKHKFMPGLFVFPGGRVDRYDGSAPSIDSLHPIVEQKLLRDMKGRATARRARGMALAAIRETYEEAGLFLGRKAAIQTDHADWQGFVEQAITPALSDLRFIARAITPPGRIRRYDTRFFAAFADAVAYELPEGKGPTDELEDIHWLTFDAARALELPSITRAVIDELEAQLRIDPELATDRPVPHYYMRRNRFCRELI